MHREMQQWQVLQQIEDFQEKCFLMLLRLLLLFIAIFITALGHAIIWPKKNYP